MSKLRQNVPMPRASDAPIAAESDLRAYVIFTQLRKDGPYIYAGWLDAADHDMAITFAIEHYGRDQACTSIWAAPREFVGGMRENVERAEEPVGEPRDYQLFTQPNAGDQHASSVVVSACSAAEAIRTGSERIANAGDLHNIWAIPVDELLESDDASLVWRNVDQTYRLARGYSKDVREKWETIRAERDIDEYEREDLKEMF